MEQPNRFNQAQYEIINALSCLEKEDDIVALKTVIVQFLNSRLQNELDRLWDEGSISHDIIDKWGKEHMRTPYK